ncbi:MAG: LLM class flavin-dependent oxidoreductase [Chloroflexi bacterium]|nr:MAG: LLM class flavin-dependent oxidoreductase [Chloroflexota bacterium]
MHSRAFCAKSAFRVDGKGSFCAKRVESMSPNRARPFRFSVQEHQAHSARQWRDRARAIEAMGYSGLYLPDHFDEQPGPIAALMSAADATSKLRVGSLVFDNDYRHPWVLAKEAATLDLLSDGRLDLGLGAGWLVADYERAGIPYDSAGCRTAGWTWALAPAGWSPTTSGRVFITTLPAPASSGWKRR